MAIKTTALGSFRGLNNRLPQDKLHVEEDSSDWLVKADNVDVTTAGTVQRRDGYKRVVDGAQCRSLWSNGVEAFVVDGTTLLRLNERAGATGLELDGAPIFSGVHPTARVSFADFNGEVFFSDGVTIHRILAGYAAPVWAETPNWKPAVVPGTGGGLPGGEYQVVVTRVNERGEESPATSPATALVMSDDDFRNKSDAPTGTLTITPPVAGHYRIYVTPQNGDVFYKVGDSHGEAFTLSMPVDGGARCPTLKLATFPACQQLAAGVNRLYGATDNTLYISEPFSPGLYNPVGGYLLFPAPITVLAATSGGVYVVADQTYWLSNAGDDLKEILPFGGAAGDALNRNDVDGVAWFSDRGLVLADNAGNAKAVQEDTVVTGGGQTAALMQRERSGMKLVTAAVTEPGDVHAQAVSWFECRLCGKD